MLGVADFPPYVPDSGVCVQRAHFRLGNSGHSSKKLRVATVKHERSRSNITTASNSYSYSNSNSNSNSYSKDRSRRYSEPLASSSSSSNTKEERMDWGWAAPPQVGSGEGVTKILFANYLSSAG